jgi:ATP-dependent DNA ligase
MAFDLLYRDGREFTGRPLRERRARLENIVAGGDLVLPVRRLAKNGFEAWTELIARDCEGLVAKDETSPYEAGPTRRWLKVKQKGWIDSVAVCCSSASASRFSASARRCSRSRTLALPFAGFGPRPISLSLALTLNRPRTR